MQGLAALSGWGSTIRLKLASHLVKHTRHEASLCRARSMAPFVHGGVPPLYIWDLFCCRCFQMLKLQPKFFLISINWRVAFQVWGKRAGENVCIYSILGKLPWAAWITQIKVQNLNLYSFPPPPPNSSVPAFALADKSQVKFPCCLARVSSAVISSSGPWTSYKLGVVVVVAGSGSEGGVCSLCGVCVWDACTWRPYLDAGAVSSHQQPPSEPWSRFESSWLRLPRGAAGASQRTSSARRSAPPLHWFLNRDWSHRLGRI